MLLEDVQVKAIRKFQLKIKTFRIKGSVYIDGFGKNSREFLKLKLIKYPQDIFNLNYQKLRNLRDGENYQ